MSYLGPPVSGDPHNYGLKLDISATAGNDDDEDKYDRGKEGEKR